MILMKTRFRKGARFSLVKERETYMNKIFGTDDVRRILAEFDKNAETGIIRDLYDVYSFMPVYDKMHVSAFAEALGNDLAYVPDPLISTMDYSPSDRLVNSLTGVIGSVATDAVSSILPVGTDPQTTEDYFRWHAGEAVRKLCEALLKNDKTTTPTDELRACAEQGEYRPICSLSWYLYALYVKRGIITPTNFGLLLRRVNCRPWGIKFFG